MKKIIKQYERDEIFKLLKEVARETPRKEVEVMHDNYGEEWARSVLLGRCGISNRRLKAIQTKRPDIPLIVLIQPNIYVKNSKRLKNDRNFAN